MTRPGPAVLAVLAVLAALGTALSAAAEGLPISDVAESLALANRAFLEGRAAEAARHYRYLATLGIKSPDPDPNLALLHRDLAEPDAALPSWTKVSLAESADGFVWNQRAWSYLALGDAREAASAFRRGLDISTMTSMQAEANLGLALAAIRDDHPKAALAPLKEAWLQGPYILPMAAYLTGLAKRAVDDEHAAMEYLGQAVERDRRGLEALKELAGLSAAVGENLKAWHYWRSILMFEPEDEDAASRMKKAARHITGEPNRLIPVRRLSRPFLDPAGKGLAAPSTSQERVRVALFAEEGGEPSHLLRTYFMTNAPFQVVARQGEIVRDSPAGGL
ncbi:MAG: tetratricopeptide repeat protein, partial [Elusimicrobiota bacterium]